MRSRCRCVIQQQYDDVSLEEREKVEEMVKEITKVKLNLKNRRSSLGGVSLTCDPVLGGLIPTPGVYSAAIPLGKVLTVHCLVFSDVI